MNDDWIYLDECTVIGVVFNGQKLRISERATLVNCIFFQCIIEGPGRPGYGCTVAECEIKPGDYIFGNSVIVDPSIGDDSGQGTIDDPYGSVQHAFDEIAKNNTE